MRGERGERSRTTVKFRPEKEGEVYHFPKWGKMQGEEAQQDRKQKEYSPDLLARWLSDIQWSAQQAARRGKFREEAPPGTKVGAVSGGTIFKAWSPAEISSWVAMDRAAPGGTLLSGGHPAGKTAKEGECGDLEVKVRKAPKEQGRGC